MHYNAFEMSFNNCLLFTKENDGNKETYLDFRIDSTSLVLV